MNVVGGTQQYHLVQEKQRRLDTISENNSEELSYIVYMKRISVIPCFQETQPLEQ